MNFSSVPFLLITSQICSAILRALRHGDYTTLCRVIRDFHILADPPILDSPCATPALPVVSSVESPPPPLAYTNENIPLAEGEEPSYDFTHTPEVGYGENVEKLDKGLGYMDEAEVKSSITEQLNNSVTKGILTTQQQDSHIELLMSNVECFGTKASVTRMSDGYA